MPDNAIRCTLITPEARVLDEGATYVDAPLWDGQAGFQANRAPIVAKLGTGELRVDLASGETKRWFIDGGFLQNLGGTVKILAKSAIAAEKITVEEARAELAEANARTAPDGKQMDAITHQRHRAQAKLSMATKR